MSSNARDERDNTRSAGRTAAPHLDEVLRPGKRVRVAAITEVNAVNSLTVRMRRGDTFELRLAGIEPTGDPEIDERAFNRTQNLPNWLKSGLKVYVTVTENSPGTIAGLIGTDVGYSYNHSLLSTGHALLTPGDSTVDLNMALKESEASARRLREGVWALDVLPGSETKTRTAGPRWIRALTSADARPHWQHAPQPRFTVWEEARSHLHSVSMGITLVLLVWVMRENGFGLHPVGVGLGTAHLGISERLASLLATAMYSWGFALALPALFYGWLSLREMIAQTTLFIPLRLHQVMAAIGITSALSAAAILALSAVAARVGTPTAPMEMQSELTAPVLDAWRAAITRMELDVRMTLSSRWYYIGGVGVYTGLLAALSLSSMLVSMRVLRGDLHRVGVFLVSVVGIPLTIVTGMARKVLVRLLVVMAVLVVIGFVCTSMAQRGTP